MSVNTDPIFALQQQIKDLEKKLEFLQEDSNNDITKRDLEIADIEHERDEWRKDAERLIQLANFNNKKAIEYFNLHEELVKKYEVRE